MSAEFLTVDQAEARIAELLKEMKMTERELYAAAEGDMLTLRGHAVVQEVEGLRWLLDQAADS